MSGESGYAKFCESRGLNEFSGHFSGRASRHVRAEKEDVDNDFIEVPEETVFLNKQDSDLFEQALNIDSEDLPEPHDFDRMQKNKFSMSDDDEDDSGEPVASNPVVEEGKKALEEVEDVLDLLDEIL